MIKKILFFSVLFAIVVGVLKVLFTFHIIPVAYSNGVEMGAAIVYVSYITHRLKK